MQSQVKLGMALFLVSESVFFLMLIMAFVIFRNQSAQMAAQTLNFPVTSFYSVCLLASGFTLWRATRTARGHGDGSPRLWLTATILLGSVFLLGQGSQYLNLLQAGDTVNQGLFGTTFFTLTSIHGFHVLIGIGMLVAMLSITTVRGPALVRPALAIDSVALFWHFVVGVWIVIFLVVYMSTFLTGTLR
jgi:cytochrome c oxidase subunit III